MSRMPPSRISPLQTMFEKIRKRFMEVGLSELLLRPCKSRKLRLCYGETLIALSRSQRISMKLLKP